MMSTAKIQLGNAPLAFAMAGLLLFLAVCLLISVSKAFAQGHPGNPCRPALVGKDPCLSHPQRPAGDGRAAPFQLYDWINGAYFYRDPGSELGGEVGMFNAYCVRAILRQKTNLLDTPFKDNVVSQFCVKKSSNGTDVDPSSGSLTFPQPILQISRCEETGPLGHASANPACGPFYDVDVIGRDVTGSPFYP